VSGSAPSPRVAVYKNSRNRIRKIECHPCRDRLVHADGFGSFSENGNIAEFGTSPRESAPGYAVGMRFARLRISENSYPRYNGFRAFEGENS
jgi:hypothetical protein